MDTDNALSIATIVGLALCCICGVTVTCYKVRTPRAGAHMKVSRSDPDLENLEYIVADSLPTHK